MERASESLQASLVGAIETAHVAAAEAMLDSFAAASSYQAALTELLEPVLLRIGAGWEAGKPTILAQGYLAAKLTERVLVRALAEAPTRAPEVKALGPVLVGNIEDDFHSLGRRMLTTFLMAAGFEVHDLGNDVPVATFLKIAVERHARVIGVSAMMYTTAGNIRGLREAIDQAGLRDRLQLAVGGAVFNLRPELVGEVGGDGSAKSALVAPALFETLARRSVAAGDAP
jgi:methanogenic corrinoid protein MtbC1